MRDKNFFLDNHQTVAAVSEGDFKACPHDKPPSAGSTDTIDSRHPPQNEGGVSVCPTDTLLTPSDPQKSPLCSDTAQVPLSYSNNVQKLKVRQELVAQWLKLSNHEKVAYRLDMCGTTSAHMRCQEGHEKYIRMRCHNDFCVYCGTKWSTEHKKRATRAMDRLVYLPLLGYMVFTLPDHFMAAWPDKAALKYLSGKVWKLVKKHFDVGGGVVRTHLMGEKGDKLHIHFNVLFNITRTDGKGEVPIELLRLIRKEWTSIVNKFFGLKLENTNVWYSFVTHLGQKIHKVKYIFRPIVTSEKFIALSDDDKEYVLSLTRRHNTRWFGKLANPVYKKYLKEMNIPANYFEDRDISMTKKCPIDGSKFKFVDVVDANNLPREGFRRIDGDTLVDFALFSFIKDRGG